jgi:OmpA-OmpF porin, OOP family
VKALLAASLAVLGTAAAANPAYVTQGEGVVWMNPYGLCWRTTAWSPGHAKSPCDALPQAAAPVAAPPAPPPAPVVRAPEPAPAPVRAAPLAVAPSPVPAPAPVVARPAPPEKISLSADLLFAFNSAVLRDAGKEKLDQLAARLRGANVEEIRIVGHADRLGSDAYNKRISEERAASVREHLLRSAQVQNIRTAGMGKSQPVTGDRCKAVRNRTKLIDCLQPDRRVDLEILGTSAASGATAIRVKAD